VKTIAVCDIKKDFDSILTEVENGNEVVISKNHNEEPFALIKPFRQNQWRSSREGVAPVEFSGGIKMTAEELINPDTMPKNKKRKAGCAKGQIWMSDDFDEPPEDFKEYM